MVERELFERYEHSKKPCAIKSKLFEVFTKDGLDEDEYSYIGKYVDSFMQEKWELWLRAKKLEGCVVVPVEPTQGMIDAMEQFDDRYDYADMTSAYKAMLEAARGGNEN